MKLINKLFLFATLCFVMGSCTDDEMETSHANEGLVVKLALPDDKTVDINTRSTTGNTISDVLVVMLRDEKVKYQFFNNLSTLSFTITNFTPKVGDAVYVFCNTGKTSVIMDANTEDKLLEELIASNNAVDLMYSKSTSIYDRGLNEIKLEHSLAKVCLYSDESGLKITNWKVCNVPNKGFMSKASGYPNETSFENEVNVGTDSCTYIVPRTDNSTVVSKTYLLLQIEGKGWYRLDFRNSNRELNSTDIPSFINIERNYRYRFNILSVRNDGYQTAKQAADNPGSNIVYKMDIADAASSLSNGQYSLITNKDKIELPSLDYSVVLPVMDISVKIPDALKGTITGPYSVILNNPNGGLKLWADGVSGTDINLLDIVGDDLSKKIILSLSIDGFPDLKDTYIEIRCGNLVKRFPISQETANCYIHNFQDGKDLVIPIEQANKNEERIDLNDDVNIPDAEILWSDHSIDFDDITASYDENLKSIRIHKNNPGSFVGNLVVAIKVGTVIKWSWHVWCMDNTSVQFNNQTGRYKLTHTQKYGNLEWMDRNLGATSIAKNDIANEGLLYQWGRKDPFPGSSTDGAATEPMLYHRSGSYLFNAPHPSYGVNFVTKNESDNIEYSIENPTKFIQGNDYEWFVEGLESFKTADTHWVTNTYTQKFEYLWTTPDGDKTVYDPCPIGWRVAHNGKTGPWISLRMEQITGTDGGMEWGDVYYPWVTSRDQFATLEFESASRIALWWGTIPTPRTNTNSTIFSITHQLEYSKLTPSAYAISVRCVKE